MSRSDRPPLVHLIEDDPVIGRHLVEGLQGHGYRTRWSTTGGDGLALAQVERPDVLLLDLGLPDLDGVDVVRACRAEQPRLVILILTARGDDIDVVAGLDAGADDYLVKPFSLAVLLARLRTRLRHISPRATPPADAFHSGALSVDRGTRRCHAGQSELPLRPKEFALLLELVKASGRAVPREHLMAAVWDETQPGSTKTLDVTMAALRRRLDQAGRSPRLQGQLPTVTTLRGYGYRLDAPEKGGVDGRGEGDGAIDRQG